MAAEFTSHLPEVRKKIEAATDAALIAAALVLVNVIKKVVTEKGYTSGAFRNTLLRRNHIRHSEVSTENGRRVIRVGVLSGIPNPSGGKATVGEIMLWWEVGHVSVWTGKYERVEIFRPAALEAQGAMTQAAQQTFRRVMAA